ncbi:MAG: nucleotidyltransferase domain-containing protein [Oscillospiraceae bacterium]|nr:nucleotidyltransferase domain-containing protein [Oscillospiraceae bacterium]
MTKHHEESILHMTEHYRANPEIKALFLVGSVATGTERPDSDLDGVAVISQDFCEQRKAGEGLEEVYFGKCTYEGGYFNIHYMSREDMEELARSGSEPMRNMFSCAQPLFCDEPDLLGLAAKIPVFREGDAAAKQFKFYCTLKMYHTYFWKCCRPEGYFRHHIAQGMVYNLYRLILIENKTLFPSVRKLEESVRYAPDKPEGILELCHSFMKTLSDEECLALVERYEAWTSYDYPKDHNVVMNNFSNPYEWN